MPFLNIEDAASAVELYKNVFGATVLMRDEEPSGIVQPCDAQDGRNDGHAFGSHVGDVNRTTREDCRGRRERTADRRCNCTSMLRNDDVVAARGRGRREDY